MYLPKFPTYIDFLKKWDNFGEETTMWDNFKNNRGLALPKPMDVDKSPSFEFKDEGGKLSATVGEFSPESNTKIYKSYTPIQFCMDSKAKFTIKGKDLNIVINRDPMGFNLFYKDKKYFANPKNPTLPAPANSKAPAGKGRS